MVTRGAWLGWVALVTVTACSGGAVGPTPSRQRGDVAPMPAERVPGGSEAGTDGVGTNSGMDTPARGGSPSEPTPSSPIAGSAGSVAVTSATGDKAYPGHGFVVHEWGTDTIVVGSDGSLQRGLHHEEEDLPAFVYDRLKAASSLSGPSLSVTIKMETPVTYFYSDVPLEASVRVDFPKGVLTQWYPAASQFLPPLIAADGIEPGVPAALADPVLDLDFPFVQDMCRERFSALSGGLLDWGSSVHVLARGTDIETALAPAPLADFSWSHARAVDANPLALGAEVERFLFYRGLGDFDLPVHVTTTTGGGVTLRNDYTESLGSVFFINVDAEHGAFTAQPQGVAAGATLSASVPGLEAAEPLSTYAEGLSAAVTASLEATGLYHDEALAMVNTWKRQWFRTPGARLLYVIPQSWTESSIPLSITPKPEALLRVMLIRVELITPEQEQEDVRALASFEQAPSEAEQHFDRLGRFAEPRLRRALALSPSASGSAYLAQIARAGGGIASGE